MAPKVLKQTQKKILKKRTITSAFKPQIIKCGQEWDAHRSYLHSICPASKIGVKSTTLNRKQKRKASGGARRLPRGPCSNRRSSISTPHRGDEFHRDVPRSSAPQKVCGRSPKGTASPTAHAVPRTGLGGDAFTDPLTDALAPETYHPSAQASMSKMLNELDPIANARNGNDEAK